MRSDQRFLSSWAVAGLYIFGLLLFFWPFTDLVSNAMPPQPGNVQWRYGFAGLMAAYLQTPILGLLLVTGTAWMRGHARTLRWVSVFELLVALGVVLVVIGFALDLLQVRAARPEPARPAVLAGGIIAILKHVSGAGVLTLLGIGGLKTAGKLGSGAGGADDAGRIVMKQQQS